MNIVLHCQILRLHIEMHELIKALNSQDSKHAKQLLQTINNITICALEPMPPAGAEIGGNKL